MNSPLGNRIKALRAHHKMTQGTLAYRAGVTRSWLSQIETGGRGARPNAEYLDRVAGVLGVTTHYLLRGDEGEGVAVRVRPSAARLFEKWKHFTDERLEAIDVWLGAWGSEEQSQNPMESESGGQARDGRRGEGKAQPPAPPAEFSPQCA